MRDQADFSKNITGRQIGDNAAFFSDDVNFPGQEYEHIMAGVAFMKHVLALAEFSCFAQRQHDLEFAGLQAKSRSSSLFTSGREQLCCRLPLDDVLRIHYSECVAWRPTMVGRRFLY